MSLADNRFFLPVTRALIRTQGGTTGPTLLAEAGAPLATGYRILRFYSYHGALATRREGLEVDARKMITLAGGLRTDQAVPDRELANCPDPATASRLLSKGKIEHALAFRSAADRIGYFEPVETLSLFIRPEDHRAAVSNLTVRGARGTATLHHHDLGRLEIMQDADGIPITSPLQTVLDLAADPRGGAHRSFLESVLRKRGELPG